MPVLEHRRTLWALLVIRLAWASLAVALLLFVFYFTKYVIDTPNLRRLTLEAESRAIINALRYGRDPTQLAPYHAYPDAYGFRVFDGRRPDTRRLVAQTNPDLFKQFAPRGDDARHGYRSEFSEGVRFGQGPDDRPDIDRWVLTDHEDVGQRSYWVQVAMIGDPARRWIGVMADEMLDHVVIPILSVVPVLALAMMLTIAFALRPLERTARQAAALGAAVGSGVRMTPLSTEHLPVEFNDVVVAINAMLAKLEHAFDLQKQFTADAAHELRTPLAVLLLQLDELPPGPLVDNVREGVRGLAGLIEQLLLFAQAEDAAKQERGSVDVAGIARKVCEELADTAFNRAQTIEFEAADIPTLPGHAALIETAIRNVVANAIKYSPPGTAIAVEVDAAAQVIVSDRGPGIRDDHKELVFNRFWRANRRRADGAGIGLALVQRIAELHGGAVRIEDRRGGGTRFVLRFAAAAPAPAPALANRRAVKSVA
ncbi:MAG TPA: HAMP domain-containing sensor histidine kinase [Pseudolabrys sp.]|nr:HAMP domain-containing sensor histidine kinase [Pseudolabrys sp.]